MATRCGIPEQVRDRKEGEIQAILVACAKVRRMMSYSSFTRRVTSARLPIVVASLGVLTGCAEMMRNMRPEYRACKEHIIIERDQRANVPATAVYLGEVQGTDDLELIENGCAKGAHALVDVRVRDYYYVSKGASGPLLVARAIRFRSPPEWVPRKSRSAEETQRSASVLEDGPVPRATAGPEPERRSSANANVPASVLPTPASPTGSVRSSRDRVFITPVRGQLRPEVLAALFDVVVVNVERADVVDKTTLEDVQMQMEHERLKDALDCSSAACATELAGMLGVRYLLSATAKKLGSTVFFTINLIDTRDQRSRTGQGQCQDREEDYPRAVTSAVKEVLGLVKRGLEGDDP